MLGKQTLFNDIIEQSPLRVIKGRSERLDSHRNKCIIDRYLYIMKHTGWRYDLMLQVIGRDFFLSERTVVNILNENSEIFTAARKNMPAKKDLEKKWPQFNWDVPELGQYNH